MSWYGLHLKNGDWHIIPALDNELHELHSNCECNPIQNNMSIYTHHAYDKRETYENDNGFDKRKLN